MELVPYKEFGNLRIRSFFPANAELFVDESGSTECAIGPARTEGLAFTYFAWRESRVTAEISLDFRDECPVDIATAILKAIHLPLRPGMSLPEIEMAMGKPEFVDLSKEGEGFVRFICGEENPYFVGCQVTNQQGLISVNVFRKDYAVLD